MQLSRGASLTGPSRHSDGIIACKPGGENSMRIIPILFVSWLALSTNDLGAEPRTRNVILVTLDGVRTQEIFSGMDAEIAAHSAQQVYSEIAVAEERYWAESPAERRKLLMPFFWGTLVPSGMVFGNEATGSRMLVRNAVKWSSPGYAEMLTGEPHADIVDNRLVRYPFRTVLEFVAERKDLAREAVAQIGSWNAFALLAASHEDAFVMNAGYEPFPADVSTPAIDHLVGLRRDVQQLWEESSNDTLTYHIAKEYLNEHEPRLLWLGMSQSDDWAHADRYDRLLEYLHLTDRLLADLWATIEANPRYKGKTTLIVTTDHGRGLGPSDWAEHDETIPGSESIWLAVIGPDTPHLGEAVPEGTVYQADIAATIVQLFGLNPDSFNRDAGPPLPGVISAR